MTTTTKTTNENQLKELISKAEREKELNKESYYLSQYKDILQKHKASIFQLAQKTPSDSPTPNHNNGTSSSHPQIDYAAETKILQKALALERECLLSAAFLGITAFLSIRYLPPMAIRFIGGEAKTQALLLSQQQSKQQDFKTYFVKQSATLFLELSLSGWAAYRGYHMAASLQSTNQNQNNIYDDLASIPLCPGKSIVSDTICDDWIQLTNHQIPSTFWDNFIQDEKENVSTTSIATRQKQAPLHENEWKAIRTFTENCIKRKRYEQIYKQLQLNEKPLSSHSKDTKQESSHSNNYRHSFTSISIPTPVPTNILELTQEEISHLLHSNSNHSKLQNNREK